MTISVNLPNEYLPYLNSIYIKSLSTTINTLITYFRENNLSIITAGRRADNTQIYRAAVSAENAAYIEANKTASKSFTIACLVATAAELDIKIS
jgi:hypothetical protein